ncbi:MAG: hypothetical protein J2P29_12145, partial [Actinobacteria bacterium]|nr:hypothetical protein [Actinomycetota bacterium]
MSRQAGARETDGFHGQRPDLPEPQIERPELLGAVVDALRAHDRAIAITGPGGAGKTVLAAQACQERRLRR